MENKRKLTPRAYDYFRILADTSFKNRMVSLEKADEYGFAILILWNRIEITLKLLKYYDKMPDFPDKLDFIDRRWSILNNVYNYKPSCYDLIINKAKSNSLWKNRDKIAHTSKELDNATYQNYKTEAQDFLTQLSQNLLSQNNYLAKRRRMRD